MKFFVIVFRVRQVYVTKTSECGYKKNDVLGWSIKEKRKLITDIEELNFQANFC